MAIYHFSAQVMSRSKGQSSVAASAYRSGDKLHDERTGENKYYAREVKPENEILAPENAPNWVYNREKLWNAVEKVEVRKDAQVAREINIALPHELSNEQQKELVREYVKDQFVNQGMVADIAIHRDDKNNPHAHVMLTTRHITNEGFGNKNREWNDKQQLEIWRSEWAKYANQSLEKAGFQERIDHRSHMERKLEALPTKHMGHVAAKFEKEGKQTEIGDYNRAIKAYNQTIISLAEYREQKKEIQQQQEQQKNFSPAEVMQLKEAAKVLKGYASLENIHEQYSKFDKQEQRIEKNIDYLKWKDNTIQQASSIYQNINNFKERIHESKERINSINWLNPFKLGDNRAVKEINEKDIQKYERAIEQLEIKLNYHEEKLKFSNEQEFYVVRDKFDYDGLYRKNLSERKEINKDRNTLLKAQQILEQGFVRQVASNYDEAHEMNYMTYKTAQTLNELNKSGIKTPEEVEEIINVKEREIKDIESQLERIDKLEARVERVGSYLNKHEEMAKFVQKIESSPVAKAKMMISKSAKVDYERAVSIRDTTLVAAKAEGIPSRVELTRQKEKLERMRANVPATKQQLHKIKQELKPFLEVQQGIIVAKQAQYKAVTRNVIGQEQKGKGKIQGMERELERGLYPKRNRELSR